MRLLAHYTIFGEDIFNLHTFDIEKGNIKHNRVAGETAHTAFIQGILIFARHLTEDKISEINNIVAENKTESLRIIAEKIAAYLIENKMTFDENNDFSLLISTYPDFILSKL